MSLRQGNTDLAGPDRDGAGGWTVRRGTPIGDRRSEEHCKEPL